MSVKIPIHEKMFWVNLYQFDVLITRYSTDFHLFLFFFLNLAAILELCKLESEDAIFPLDNIGFWIQYTKIPLIGISKTFLHTMPVPSEISVFF